MEIYRPSLYIPVLVIFIFAFLFFAYCIRIFVLVACGLNLSSRRFIRWTTLLLLSVVIPASALFLSVLLFVLTPPLQVYPTVVLILLCLPLVAGVLMGRTYFRKIRRELSLHEKNDSTKFIYDIGHRSLVVQRAFYVCLKENLSKAKADRQYHNYCAGILILPLVFLLVVIIWQEVNDSAFRAVVVAAAIVTFYSELKTVSAPHIEAVYRCSEIAAGKNNSEMSLSGFRPNRWRTQYQRNLSQLSHYVRRGVRSLAGSDIPETERERILATYRALAKRIHECANRPDGDDEVSDLCWAAFSLYGTRDLVTSSVAIRERFSLNVDDTHESSKFSRFLGRSALLLDQVAPFGKPTLWLTGMILLVGLVVSGESDYIAKIVDALIAG